MNEEVYDPDKPESRLHGLFSVLFYISAFLFVVAFACDFLNGLDNFLHAPIGIKDNPPEPGFIVELAQLLWWPLILTTMLLGYFRVMTRLFKFVPLLLGTLIVFCGVVSLVGGILGEYKGQLFSGQTYFTQTITPIMWATFITSWVGVGAYRCFTKWKKERRVRYLIAGSLVSLGIFCAAVGVLGSLGSGSDVITQSGMVLMMCGVLMAVLGYIVCIAPGNW